MALKVDQWIAIGLAVAVGGVVAYKFYSAPKPKKQTPDEPKLLPYEGTRDFDGHVYYDVLVNNLAIHSLPSSDSAVIGKLPAGAIVTSTGYTAGGLSSLSKKYVEILVPPSETVVGWSAAAGLKPHNA